MTKSLRHDMIAGGLVGLVSGFVFGWAMNAQGMMVEVTGQIGLSSAGASWGLHLLILTLGGVAFGAIFRYQPQGYAASLSNGLLFGLLAWIAIPLTLNPLLLGEGPTWSLAEAGAAFPGLIGYLLYGGLTGLGFAGLVTQYLRLRPETELTVEAEPARRVLILGGGYAGMSAAQRLEQLYARDPDLEITLVSQSNFLLFTPLLAEVAASALAAQHISTPLRAVCPRTRFLHAAVEAIDPDSQTVQVRANSFTPVKTVHYDQLVLALGAVPNFYDLPGLEANAFTLKTLQDATGLRNHIISLLERADVEQNGPERRRLLTFVVAGAGFAGVEILASLFDMVHSILRYYPEIPRDELRFILVHSQSRILPELTPELAAYAQRKLENRGIEFVLGVRVTGATPDKVQLNDGSHRPTCTLIWTAGNQPNPLLKTLPGELDQRGAVVTDSTLRVKGLNNVWAVGDCAVIPDVDNEDKPFPPTAQHALREGKVVAENIAAVLRNKSPKPFRFKTIGLLVSLGHRTAAAEILGHRFSGLLAWFMWRTIYWGKLPGLEKKMRVAIDWTIDLFFPRDIVLTICGVYRMKWPDVFKRITLPGALAGLVGGLVFGAAMIQLGMLPTIASLVHTESGIAGFIIHMILAAILGVGFSLLVWHQRGGAGEMLFWGLIYGTLWWFLGPLTLLPLLVGQGLMWDIHAVQAAFPSLPGHLWYGASMAIALTLLQRAWPVAASGSSNNLTSLPRSQLTAAALARGALAGLLGAWLLGAMLAAQDQLLAFSAMMSMGAAQDAWLLILVTGVLAGLGYALLYPRPSDSAGAGLIRGTVYGFFWWVAGALTLLPLLDSGHLAWVLKAAQSSFALLPGFLLFGAAMTLFYHGFDTLTRVLFADITLQDDQEGVGTQGLRVLGRGIMSGTIGGLLFTVVIVQLGFLPTVASLIGSTSPLTGFIVHLVISELIGISYGLLFQRQSYDVGSALGWGMTYGFFWWILGPLTLMPILLGAPPQWTIEAAAGALGSLIGHLVYGAGLGITFYLLEARHNPWWIPRGQVEATRIKRRKAQVFTSAPALWVMVVIIALTVPVVLGM